MYEIGKSLNDYFRTKPESELTEWEKKSIELRLKIAELESRARWDKIEQERKDRELLYKIAEKLGIYVNPAPPLKSQDNEPDHEG